MPKPKDITQLRDELLDAFEMVKQDPRRALQVKEMSNAAGKIIGTLKTQLEYALMRQEEPDIAFMGQSSRRPLKNGAVKQIGDAPE